ncbi:Metallo-dependent phosphatase [Hypoxylon sp. FL1857]|nr:Metallo-dependent phosphatase [Hypoxylon sp. FL1857]
MGRRESPPSRTQRRKQHRRSKLATAGTIFTIVIFLILLYYTRFHEYPPIAPMAAQEIDVISSHPTLKKPTLLANLPPSALPKPNGGPDSPRLIIIGDVHGQLSALDALLAKVGFSAARGDQVVFTGDMVNKGPDSSGVIDRAISINARGVRGNHEDRVLRAWAKHHHKHPHLNGEDGGSGPTANNGKKEDEEGEEEEAREAKAQKLAKSEALDRSTASSLSSKQVSWLANLPVILRLGTISPYYGDVVVAHAGLVPGVPLEKQDPWAAMNMRTLLTPSHSHSHSTSDSSSHKPTFQPSEGREGRPWSKIWNEHQKSLPKEQRTTVVYGHDAKVGLSVRRYAFGLDSSCVKGGDLTALVFEPVSASTGAAQTLNTDERIEQDGHDEEAVAERAKHGITHRIVSVSCEAAVSDDDKGKEKEKKDKKKDKDKDKKKSKKEDS